MLTAFDPASDGGVDTRRHRLPVVLQIVPLNQLKKRPDRTDLVRRLVAFGGDDEHARERLTRSLAGHVDPLDLLKDRVSRATHGGKVRDHLGQLIAPDLREPPQGLLADGGLEPLDHLLGGDHPTRIPRVCTKKIEQILAHLSLLCGKNGFVGHGCAAQNVWFKRKSKAPCPKSLLNVGHLGGWGGKFVNNPDPVFKNSATLYRSMTILLLGASGRLGTAFERLLISDHFLTPDTTELDLTDTNAVESYVSVHPEIELILNCAAYNAVDLCETDSEEAKKAHQINVTAPGVLALVASTHQLPFIHFSSDYVFAGDQTAPYTENDSPAPISVYGHTKADGERAALAATGKIAVVRTSRLYGPNGRAEGSKRSFVEIILAEAQKGDLMSNPIEVGSPTFVDDLVRHVEIHLLRQPFERGIYHMTNTGACTWFEWAQTIVALAHLPVTVTPRTLSDIPARPAKRPPCAVLTSTKIPPMRPWQEALKEYLETL